MRVSLRPIEYKDIETLRFWRNENKDAFFYNKLISKEEQIKWFKGYLKRETIIDEHLYIIEYQDKDIGCIGYRSFGDCIELYNVMIGDKKYLGKSFMKEALYLLCAYIRYDYSQEIIVRVLKDNKKAITFYTKNGGEITGEIDNYIVFTMDFERMQK